MNEERKNPRENALYKKQLSLRLKFPVDLDAKFSKFHKANQFDRETHRLKTQNAMMGLSFSASNRTFFCLSLLCLLLIGATEDLDKDECSKGPCGFYAKCSNTPSSFSCACIDGFQGNGRDNCTDVNECLASSTCSPNAVCKNLVGTFDCDCKPGYYGNRTVCYPETLLSKADALMISEDDIISAPTGVPFLIGEVESSVFRVRGNGLISFSNKSLAGYEYNSPGSLYHQTRPIVAPYWVRRLIDIRRSNRWITSAWYELLNSGSHAARKNFRAVKRIIEHEIRSEFNPLSVLIVTWRIRIPSLGYLMEVDCYSGCSYVREPETKGWNELCKDWCDRARAKASIEFQAAVTRNQTHSYAIFNYGNFRLPVLRFINTRFQLMNLYAAAGFTDGFSVGNELPFSQRYDWPEQPNLSPGSSGRHGRHVLQLSRWYRPSSDASKCSRWIAETRAQIAVSPSPGCSECPFDFRTAVLDRRYSAYDFDCSGGSIRMCFLNTSYHCAQSFSGSEASDCKPADSWSCRFQNCRHLVSTRCCYRMSSATAGSDIRQLCNADLSVSSVRNTMRRVMFDRPPAGYLISSSSDGAGHAMYFFREKAVDSLRWGWFHESTQYLSETYGLRVCTAAGMMSAFSMVRPVCTSRGYRPPAGGFNRGDPHLSTLSNRSYTFNGHCEYHLLTSERSPKSPPLWLQARTTPVRRPGGSSVSGGATSFVAVALKSGVNELAVAVVRNEDTNDLDVFSSDGRRIGGVREELLARSNATRLDGYRVEAADNRTVSIVEESAGVSVTVAMETHSLRVGVQLDSAGRYPEGLDGLLGNSYSGGFRLRNGSVLAADSTEKQLFEFGNSWRLIDSDPSYLPYPTGKGRSEFCNLSFVPTFAEDFKDNMPALFDGNVELMNAADAICKNSSSSQLSCMFDAAQLRSVAAAQDAATAIGDETQTRAVLANRPAEFRGAPNQIRVTGNNSVGVSFSVTDPDGGGSSPRVTVQEASGGTARLESDDGRSWQLVWEPKDNWSGDIKLQLAAVDSVGAVTVWTPTVVVCDCDNGGTCCIDCSRADDTAYFRRLKCKCQPELTGSRCEQRIPTCPPPCEDPVDEGGNSDVDDQIAKVAISAHKGPKAWTAFIGAAALMLQLLFSG